MRNSFLIVAVIAGVMLTGCSKEEIASVETSKQNAIGFNVVNSNAESRATPITSSNITTTDFDVFAFTKDGSAFMGKVDTEFAHDGVKITWNGNAWDYNDKSELRYWPSTDTPLDFYAVSPGSVVADYALHYAWNFNHDSQVIYYACMNEYGEGTGKHADHDVMYGIAKDQKKDTNQGKVKFTFKHILSQVVFQAKTALPTLEVEINGIKINNAKISGSFTLPTDAATEPTAENWTLTGGTSTTLGWYSPVVIRNAAISVASTTDATDISTNTPIFVIPQQLTKWDVNGANPTIASANDVKQSYLEITCKIKQSGVYVFGSENAYATLYVPFEADWQPGKRYIYTLIFGGGYDEDGKQILTPITFDAETTDWVDATGSDIQY